ncbi:HAD-IB family phosphatase [Streptomyces sp. NBC_00820]|uniref:HAD family hydrolase n=1 Tax=Streptomyces sp. NBC_00820 TaxID=2975842 RepID=UPI002ED2E256|nr:HAD-IB family phosphatase [Streptomyces sp. NBC_00820]
MTDTAGAPGGDEARLLHVFDMDGTLLRRTTASLEISRRLDCLPDLIRLEADFAAGTIDTRGFAAKVHRLWQELTPELAADVFAKAPWIGGLAHVLADIRRRGGRSVVVTMSPDFFADRLKEYGVDEVVASRFPPLPFRTAPDPTGILTPADKVTAVDRIRTALGLGRDSCVAYGDSGSDIPLFRELRRTVAVNADEALRRLARHRYDGDDLRVAYRMALTRPAEHGTPSSPHPKEHQ